MAFWAAIPAIASLASGLFGKKKKEDGQTVSAQQMMPAWQSAVGEGLSSWIQQYMKNFVPGEAYGGKFTADMTDLEKMGLDQLGGVMNAPATGDLFAAGKQQIMDTLGGKYANPNESPFIKSMIALSKQNLGDLINTERANRGARGTYYTKAGVNAEGLLNERTQNYLNSVVGDFMNTERGRMFEAAPIAQEMDKYGTLTAPLAKIQASQTLGSLQRTIEQADLEAQYQDFERQRKEMAMPINSAQSLYGTQTQYGIPSWQMPSTQENNSLGNILGMISKLNFSGMSGSGDIWSKIAGLFGGN